MMQECNRRSTKARGGKQAESRRTHEHNPNLMESHAGAYTLPGHGGGSVMLCGVCRES